MTLNNGNGNGNRAPARDAPTFNILPSTFNLLPLTFNLLPSECGGLELSVCNAVRIANSLLGYATLQMLANRDSSLSFRMTSANDNGNEVMFIVYC